MSHRLTESEQRFLNELYAKMRTPMYNLAIRTLRQKSLAKDAVQETMLIASKRINVLKKSSNPQGWLMNTLKYVLDSFRRARSMHNRFFLVDNSIDSMQELVPDPKADKLNPDVLYAGMIGEEDYHILRRIGIEGASISEVAAELGVSLPTVRKRIQRAKNRFRKQYERQIGMVKRKNKKN